ncbi:MAG: hypothetical protein ABS79_01880 [Planctomycetes bacterium SCN 63-9]|nr:MAG: hypothetical protein ABS79_01880 [Planctomycetes bacterium SCN 63-9]
MTTVRGDVVEIDGIEQAMKPDSGARLFVWGVWALMTLSASALVVSFGSDVPIWDDYGVVLAAIGDQPINADWLWEQANEYRIPIPKLILVAVDRLAGNDVRAGMAASVVCLSALSAALIALAGRLRGGLKPFDAVYPILLLHPGHAPNLLWSFMFSQILPTAIGGGILIAMISSRSWPGARRAAWIGAALALLPLCGGTGLLHVPALAAWLLASAWVEFHSGHPDSRRRGTLILLATVPGLLLTVLYFRGFRWDPHPPAPGGIFDNMRAALQFLAGGLGAPASWGWPWTGWGTLAAISIGLAILIRGWVVDPRGRSRVAALAAFLAAILTLGAGVGWGRGWAGPLAGFQDRYVAMATPLWCWLAIVFQLYAPPIIDSLGGNTLFAFACILLWPNAEAGLASGRGSTANAQALGRDIQAGMPPYKLVSRHTPAIHPSQDELARLLPKLRKGRLGPFRQLRDDPPHRGVSIPVTPTALQLADWDRATSTAHIKGVDPQLVYRLASPRPVLGVRIGYSHSTPDRSPARFQLTWLRPGQSSYNNLPAQRYALWTLPTGSHRQTTVWIDDVVQEFRIQPDNQPCDFQVESIMLLEPDAAPASARAQPSTALRPR